MLRIKNGDNLELFRRPLKLCNTVYSIHCDQDGHAKHQADSEGASAEEEASMHTLKAIFEREDWIDDELKRDVEDLLPSRPSVLDIQAAFAVVILAHDPRNNSDGISSRGTLPNKLATMLS